MKKTLLFISLIMLSVASIAGGPEYQKAMGAALGQMSACKTVVDFQNVANQFERISKIEQEEWLPIYYHAHCYIIMSFIENGEKDLKDEYLDVAEVSIEKLLELEPENAETHALHGFYYTGRLVVNPAVRGMKYGMLSSQAVGKALKIDPNNPRAQYMQIQNEMGQAQFFGKDVTPYCDQAKAALKRFDSFKVESRLHPSWGKEELKNLSESCNK